MSTGTESLTDLMTELSALLEQAIASLVSGQRLAGPAAPQDHPSELVPDPAAGSIGVGLVYGDDAVVAIALTRPFATEIAGAATPEAVQESLSDLLGAMATGRGVEVTQVIGLESDDDLIAFLGGRPGLVGAGLFEGDGVIATFGAAGSASPATTPPVEEAPAAATSAPVVETPSAQPSVSNHATIDAAIAAPHHIATAPIPSDRLARGLAMLADVHLEVTAELGRTKLRVSELLSLEPGSVIGLEREAGSPVDLLVNGTLFARAEVIVVDNQYAVRITELVGGGVPQ